MTRILLTLLALSPVSALGAEKVAATVNGEAITLAEVDGLLAQSPTAKKPTSPLEQRQRRLEAVNLLVDDKLIRQFLKTNGPAVEAVEVERQFNALVAAQKAEGKSIDQYLKEVGLTADQIKDNFRLMLQLARYLEAQGTTERLRQYFDLNRDFFEKTTVRLSHIVLRVAPDAPAAERQKAVERLRGIRGELAAGQKDFPTAARAYSHCPSGPKGGDLGYIVRKFQAEEAVAHAAFGLKVGEVSDVVTSESGVHLVWVTDRKAGKAVRFEEAVQDVRECFEVELKHLLLLDLRKKGRVEIKALDAR